jgi:dihydropyrimidinase
LNRLALTEIVLSIIYPEGVAKGRITLTEMVELLCESPAKRFGLYPKKGALKAGSDADIITLNPNHEWTISIDKPHGAYDYTCFEGFEG